MESKMLMSEEVKEVVSSLAEVKFITEDVNSTVIQNANKVQVEIGAKKDNITDVPLSVFEHYHETTDSNKLTGFNQRWGLLAKL